MYCVYLKSCRFCLFQSTVDVENTVKNSCNCGYEHFATAESILKVWPLQKKILWRLGSV